MRTIGMIFFVGGGIIIGTVNFWLGLGLMLVISGYFLLVENKRGGVL